MSTSRREPGGQERRPVEVDEGIQALRGLAVLLVVAAHVYGPLEGRRDAAAHFHQALTFVRMPLFAAISGWVYALRPVESGGVAGYVRKRARRLLLPQLAFGMLVLFVGVFPPRLLWPSSATAAIGLLAMPRAHFWFVQSLFVISLGVVALEAAGCLRTAERWMAVTLAALLVPTLLPAAAWDSSQLGRALFLFGYFLLGLGARRFTPRLFRSWTVPAALAVLAPAVLVQELAWSGEVDLVAGRGSPLALLVGVPVILLLLRFREALPGLAWLGPYSFAIYFFHRDGATLARRALRALGEPIAPGVAFFLVLAAAVALPMLAQSVLARSRVASWLFLGWSWRGSGKVGSGAVARPVGRMS